MRLHQTARMRLFGLFLWFCSSVSLAAPLDNLHDEIYRLSYFFAELNDPDPERRMEVRHYIANRVLKQFQAI